jgi:hypothetical protein
MEVRHSACHLRQRLRQGPVPMGTAANSDRFRWSHKELTHGSCQKDDTFAESIRAKGGALKVELKGTFETE